MYIAFDAAKRKTGWAFKGSSAHSWQTGVLAPANTAELISVVAGAFRFGVRHAVIENCYLGKQERNVRTLKALQEAQTRIRVVCEMYRLSVELVYPSEWQSAFTIVGPRDTRKQLSQRVAAMLGAIVTTDDEADAVCLCEYATRRSGQYYLDLRNRRSLPRNCGASRK